MQDDTVDLYLSDVHVYTANEPQCIPQCTAEDQGSERRQQNVFSAFYFTIPPDLSGKFQTNAAMSETQGTTVDEDGDFVVARRKDIDHKEAVIYMGHAMSTPLDYTGLQVWRACLVLSDFILKHWRLFANEAVLDLGAGTGLCSIVLGFVAQKVFCTDTGEKVLKQCEQNIHRNSHLFKHNDSVLVRNLDWLCGLPNDASVQLGSKFSFNSIELHELSKVKYIFAADVVYDDDLTDAFLRTAYSLLSLPPEKTLFISVEKRLNFTLADLDVATPCYEHFRTSLQELADYGTGSFSFAVRQISISFPQCFSYERTKYMELWEVKSVFKPTTT